MKISDVRARVAQIEAYARDADFEAAHAAEDDLRDDVLRKIADGAANGAELAAEALRTEDIEFRRYYA
jgi:hypothetical protein